MTQPQSWRSPAKPSSEPETCSEGVKPPALVRGNLVDPQINLERILNALADPVFVKDECHGWLMVNDAYCQLVGYPREALLGRSEHDIFSPAEAESFYLADQYVLTTGLEYEQEATITDAHNQVHIVSTKLTLFHDSQGHPRLVATMRDITQAKQADLTLKRQAERERLLGAIAHHLLQSPSLEQLLNATVIEVRRFLQADRVIFYSCDASQLGILAESVGAATLSLLTQPATQLASLARDWPGCHQGQPWIVDDVTAANLTADDQALIHRYQIKSLIVLPIAQDEMLCGLLWVHHCRQVRPWHSWEVDALQEVTTRVGSAIRQMKLHDQIQELNTALERQVQHRTTQLQTALDFEATLKRMTDRVRDSLDEKQILQTAVKELTQALGVKGSNTALYDLEQGTSTIYYEYNTSLASSRGRVSQMEAFPEIYHQLLKGLCFQFCSKDPNPVRGHVAMLACPVLDDRGVLGDLWLINDKDYVFEEMEIRLVQQVSNQCAIAIRQARLFQAAQSQVAELERLNQLKDDFLSTVSHELRTPVTSMRVALQLLGVTLDQALGLKADLDKPKADQSRVARYFKILQEECEREISLINDLLDLQRLDVGNHPIHPQPLELSMWLPDIVNGFQARASSRQQQLDLTISPQLTPIVTDATSLERVLAELLNNACKYTPPGETIRLQVIPARVQETPTVQFRLTNTGVEIPSEEQHRIFDAFYRVPSADPWKQGGTGLGLALVQKLVMVLDGVIEVSSGNGQTEFLVELPLTLTTDPLG